MGRATVLSVLHEEPNMDTELMKSDTDGAAGPDCHPVARPDSFSGIASQRVSEAEERILRAPIPVEDLDIKPTGEVFVSHIVYRRIMLDAFGPMGWALAPIGSAMMKDNRIYQHFAL